MTVVRFLLGALLGLIPAAIAAFVLMKVLDFAHDDYAQVPPLGYISCFGLAIVISIASSSPSKS